LLDACEKFDSLVELLFVEKHTKKSRSKRTPAIRTLTTLSPKISVGGLKKKKKKKTARYRSQTAHSGANYIVFDNKVVHCKLELMTENNATRA
jgi:hypothetical protein